VRGGIELARFTYQAADRGRGIVQVGRIMPHKGMNFLIEGAGADLEVTIAGRVIDRKYFDFLQGQAAGRKVRFVIDPTDQVVTDLYRQAAVTVVASVYRDVFGGLHPTSELLGLPLLESMAVGTPVVCTDVGGMPEYMVEGRTGFIVPPNDPGALRERILRLLNDPVLAADMGRAGHEHVQQYSWSRVAQETLAAYQELNLIRS
jgi:glycosyltransferase involved in cell wall biosynthesis